MPAGCDFICQNEKCPQHKNGFAITGPWPMGQIELVISSLSKSVALKPNNKELLDRIIEQKNNGRKYARIIYPNIDYIKKIAHLVQLWSPEAKCVWEYDVVINSNSLADDIANANLPTKCPKTSGPLLNFTEIARDGINCPFCGEKLMQSRWFTNETNE